MRSEVTFETLAALDKQVRQLNGQKDRQSLPLAEELVRQARLLNNSEKLCRSILLKANVYADTFSDFDAAEITLNEAFSLAEPLEDDRLMAELYAGKGTLNHYRGLMSEAVDCFVHAIHLREKLPLSDNASKNALGSLYYGMAILYKDPEFIELRAEMLDKAIAIFEETLNHALLSRCFNAYATVYTARTDAANALLTLQRAVAEAEKTNDQHALSIYYNNLGNAYAESGDWDMSIEWLSKALTMKQAMGNPLSIAVTHMHIGLVWKKREKYPESLSCFEKAVELIKPLNTRVYLDELYKYLAEVSAAQKNFTEAYRYMQLFVEVKDNLYRFGKEASLQDARHKMEREMKEHEAQLLKQKNTEVEQYARQLENLNRELRQFAYIASHDLKEPVRMINGYLTLLKKRARATLGKDENEFINMASEGAVRINQLISDLLEYNQLLNEQPETQAVNMDEVVRDVINNLTRLVHKRHATITFSQLPTLQVHRNQMLSLFQNLISNGIKYNRSEQPLVELQAETKGSWAEFSVADNGIGIDPKYCKKVFEMFQRLHSRDEFEGTGMGLAICKKIIESYGGSIRIDANETGGTVFKFTLPTSNQ